MIEPPEVPADPLKVTAPSAVPWSMADAWLGLGLAVLIELAAVITLILIRRSDVLLQALRGSAYFQSTAVAAFEFLQLIPVIVILSRRQASWRSLGFRRFNANVLGLGCGLTALTYMILLLYGTLLVGLHVKTQGETLLEIMRATKSPVGLVFAAVVAAPFAEEIFFRGFLFQGLRQRWSVRLAIVASSLVFATMHLQLAALVPTFLLGCALAYVYERSHSIWPGMILHFLVNGFAMCAVLTLMNYPGMH